MPRGDHWPHWTERLAARISQDENGCHIWSGAVNSRGYGVIWFDGQLHLAHRAAWLAAHGTWPAAGLVIDHVCDNRRRVNPDHLREMTNAENIRRSVPNYGRKAS